MTYNISSKANLFDYCKRRLGAPVVEINVTDEQISDCFQETITFWQIYHTDGAEKVYIKHKITGSVLTLANATGYIVGDKIIALDSNLANTDLGTSVLSVSGNVLHISIQGSRTSDITQKIDVPVLIIGQSVRNERTGAITTVTDITLGDVDNKSIPIDSDVYGVSRLFPFSAGQGQSGSASLFNLQYQLRLHELGNLANVSLAYYVQTMTNLRMLDSILNGAPLFRFNRFHDKLMIDAYWGSNLNIDDWILVEGYKASDPQTFTRMYGDPWIVKHLTANIKQQWGVNLKKYQGMLLPGGIQVDGQSMYDEGTNEKKDLEDGLINNQGPLEWFTG